jgi:hypothetical protein
VPALIHLPKFVVSGDAAATAQNIMGRAGIYRLLLLQNWDPLMPTPPIQASAGESEAACATGFWSDWSSLIRVSLLVLGRCTY